MAALTKVKVHNIDTSVTFIEDPLVLTNFGSTLANTDVGFVFNRDGGINSNVALYWNETTDRITIAYTAATGLPDSNIAISKFANVAADWYFGNLAGGTTNTVWVSANVLPTANAFYNFGSPTQRWNVGYFAATTLDLGGSQISVDPTNGFKFVVGGTGTPTFLASNGLIAGSTLSSAGTITAGGAINTSANVLASQVSAGSVVTTGAVNAGGNVLASTGIFNLLDVNGNVEIGAITVPGAGHTIIGNVTQTGAGTIFYNTPGNIMALQGFFGSINSTGFINTSGNVSAAVHLGGQVSVSGLINTAGNVLAATFQGGNINVTGLINTAGNIIAPSLSIFGNTSIGAITTPDVTHVIVGNIRQSGAGTIFLNTTGNISASVGVFGAINATGYINTSGNISTAQLNTALVNSTGNVLASGGVFGALTVNGGITSTGFINTSGNVSAATGLFGAVTSTGFINTSGNISASVARAGTITTTGTLTAASINSTGNILGTSGVLNNLTVNGNQSLTGYLDVSGNVTIFGSAGGFFANITGAAGAGYGGSQTWRFYTNPAFGGPGSWIQFPDASTQTTAYPGTSTSLTLSGTISAGNLQANGANLQATTISVSTTTGALRVAGGAGIGGNTVIGGILTVGSPTGVNVANFTDTTGAFYGTANSWVQLGIQNASTAVGASTDFIAYANNGDNNTGWIDMGITGQNYINQNGQYAITGPNDGYVFMSAPTGTTGGGNLVIATGDTGVYNDVVIATGGFDTIHEQARFIDGVGLRLQQGTASINPSTGALIVQGGVGVGGNLNVQGDIRLQGNIFLTGNAITFNTNSLSITDSLLYLADNNAGDVIDIGFVGAYTNPGYQHTGLVRDASDGIWKLFSNVAAEPTTTVDFTNAIYSNLRIGNLSAVSAGFDSNVTAAYFIGTIGTAAQPLVTSLGTLTSLTASGLINTSGNILATGGVFNALTVNGDETVTGFLNVSGNVLASQARLNYLDVNGNVDLGLAGAVSGSWHTFIGNITQTTSGGAVYINTTGNVLATAGVFNALTVNGGITSTGFINTSGNVSAAQVNAGPIVATGNVTVGNLIVPAGSGRFSGTFDENSTTSGVFVGNTGTGTPSPRLGLFNGVAAQNWQIDNYFGTLRWFTPGLTRMELNSSGNLAVNGLTTIAPGSTNLDSAFTISGNVFRGGVGYHDFMRVTSTFSGVSNGNKFFRLDSVGSLEIVNSAYTAIPFRLTDGGLLSISGNINAGSLSTPGAQHTFAGNLIINGFGAIQVPAGTTTQRPSSTTAGQIRFNTDTNQFEGYGNAWAAIGGGGGGGGTPGGVSSTVQYNNGGAFAGAVNLNYVVANGAVIVSSGTSSTTTGTGALQVIGGIGVTENINAGGSITATGLINTAANVSASQVSAASVVTTGLVNAGGNVLATAGVFNALTVNGNIAIGLVSTPGAAHSIVGNVTQSGAGTIFYNTPGNIMALQGSFGSINSTGFINTSGNISAATVSAGAITSTGFINTSGNVSAAVGLFGSLNSTGFINTTGNISGAVVLGGTMTTTGTLTAAFVNSTGNILATGAIVNALTINGTTNTQTVQPLASNTYTLGTTTAWYTKTFTKAAVAQYADLAENYSSDRDYLPGTVLVFGGSHEVTISTESHDTRVAGVVSTNPAYHMNAQAEGVIVALQGRVPTKVKGPVRKGDRLVTSTVQGAAERLDMTLYQPGCIIGKSLEDIADDSIQTIEVVVGRV